jgi:hypothetical protein
LLGLSRIDAQVVMITAGQSKNRFGYSDFAPPGPSSGIDFAAGPVATGPATAVASVYLDRPVRDRRCEMLDEWALSPQGSRRAPRHIPPPLRRFFNFYILRGGFRDGGRGLYAAMSAAFYVFLKYAKVYERQLKNLHPR